MKKTKWLLLATSLTLTVIACQKEDENVIQLETSKSVIAIGEPLTVTVNHPSPDAVSRWSVQPSVGSSLDNLFSKGSNTMRFSQTGTYVISADLRTIHPDCRPSPSWDTCFSKGQTSAVLSATITVK